MKEFLEFPGFEFHDRKMISLQQRPKIDISRRSLCYIVNLLASNGEISGYDVNIALKDYYKKHSHGELVEMVEELYVKDLDTPNQAIAYWMRSVNQNGIKIAGLCLEEQVSESYTDALEAALVVIHNVLELYKESKPLLAQKAETVRGKNALEKANSIYATIKSSFRTNYAYLKEVFTNDNFYISSIEETLKQLDEKT